MVWTLHLDLIFLTSVTKYKHCFKCINYTRW
jgi:hypothetical protein